MAVLVTVHGDGNSPAQNKGPEQNTSLTKTTVQYQDYTHYVPK